MAERIVSPGVYTKEIDQSFLPGAISAIGGAVVGPTLKGPIQVPTTVTSYDDFVKIFGSYYDDSYVPYTVAEYFKNGGQAITVTRVIPESEGYQYKSGSLAVIASDFYIHPYDGPMFPGVTYLPVTSIGREFNYVSHVLHPTNQILGTPAAQTGDLFIQSTVTASIFSWTPSIQASASFSGSTDWTKTVLRLSGSYTDYDVAGATYTDYPTQNANIPFSISPTTSSYLTKKLGTSPKSTNYPLYVQYENVNTWDKYDALSDTYSTWNYDGESPGYVSVPLSRSLWVQSVPIKNYELLATHSHASTPWITSQTIGTTVKRLFRLHTISGGTNANYEIKAGIKDIKVSSEITDPDGYPTFVIEVRKVNNLNLPNSPFISTDTDKSPEIIEEFLVNLNPESNKYIARVIGDKYLALNSNDDLISYGDYTNASNYIRVEVDSSVPTKNNTKVLIPFGFEAPYSPIPNITLNGSWYQPANLYPAEYLETQLVNGKFSKNNFHGFDYSIQGNMNYLAPIPTSGSTKGYNSDFYLGDATQAAELGYPKSSPYSGSLQTILTIGETNFAENIALSTRKFMVPFQGGFDGHRPNLPKNLGIDINETNTMGFDCSTATAVGTQLYKTAFNVLSNTDYYDINMLITPGIIDSLHPAVTTEARTLVEDRQDTFYVMDSNAIEDSISVVKNQVKTLDSNYTACYWPWLKINNPVRNTKLWVPPSVLIPSVLAFNDANSAPWYAPAGLTRGGLTAVSDTYINLSQTHRNTLYDNRINPIANFPQTGIVVWGQKTLQARQSALDRVNVRRLLIAVKKFIASSTRFLVFEQNSDSTRRRFENIVNPYLTAVAANQGLYAFKVIMNAQNNTNDLVDQNILYGQLFLQPTRTAEFILLDFNIQPTGAAFPE